MIRDDSWPNSQRMTGRNGFDITAAEVDHVGVKPIVLESIERCLVSKNTIFLVRAG
jgi:hypothetical protein